MAKRVVEYLVSDLSGEEIEPGAGETVSFALDSATYEVDLSTVEAEELRNALQPYVDAARRIGGRRRSASAAKAKSNGTASSSDIREWAVENGYEVSSRGRISAGVREAYAAAH